MRRFILCFIISAVPSLSLLLAQGVKPTTSVMSVPAAAGNTTAATTTLGDYTTSVPLNYMRAFEPQRPFSLESDVVSSDRTVEEVRRTTQYFDGIGRPIQTVAWQQATSKKDLVSSSYYDVFGRSPYQFLPFVSATTTKSKGEDGNFKYDPFAQLNTFGATEYPGETYYYGTTRFEASFLNRPEAQFAPGNSWAGSENTNAANRANEHAIKTDYNLNGDNEVRDWTISNTVLTYDASNEITATLNVPQSPAFYPAKALYRTMVTDEEGTRVVEYKDIEGRVVMKKMQSTATAVVGSHDNWLCTYYVYDDFGLLRFVIPPKAVKAMLDATNWNLATDVVAELCYRYEYDARQRMIAKKIPGASWIYMVYDNKDRLVFTQDGNMRAKNWWMTTMYDVLNRLVITGMTSRTSVLTHTILISNMANLAYNSASTTVDGISVNANPTYSLSPAATFISQTKSHYDDYSWTTVTYNTDFTSRLNTGTTNTYNETVLSQSSTLLKGLVTGAEVKSIDNSANLNTGVWMRTVSFYDDKGRPVQLNSQNYKGGTDLTTNLYNWVGQIVSTMTEHNNPEAVNADASVATRRIVTDYAYDHTGKVTTTLKRIFKQGSGNNLVQIQTLRTAKNTFDPIGQLVTKNLGNTRSNNTNYTYNSVTALDNLTYTYNIRGWLKGINTAAVNGAGRMQQDLKATDSWFSMEINYDWGFGTNQYNGNIAGMKWRTRGDDKTRAYGFTYDDANRLQMADFTQYSSSGWNVSLMDFSLDNVSYDFNGNITALKQKGMKLGAKGVIDDLSYTFNQNGSGNTNRLSGVTDAQNDQYSVLGDFKYNPTTKGSNDYTYDANGNMTKDNNKKLTSITYNYLNLPVYMTFTGLNGNLNRIQYIYDAAGRKLQKDVVDFPTNSGNGNFSMAVTTTNYLGGFVYQKIYNESDVNYSPVSTNTSGPFLQYFGQEEGRVREMADGSGNAYYNFDYYEKDHLGNVRVVLTDELKQDIYPTLDFEGTPTSQAITNQNAAWDNSTGGQVDAAGTRTTKPGAMGTSAQNGQYAKLITRSTPGGAIGAAKLLKVMSGDQINASVDYFWAAATVNNGSANGLSTLTTSLVLALAASTDVTAAVKGGTAAISSSLTADPNVATKIATPENGTSPSSYPKAYLHVLLFDERFQFDEVNSVIKPIGAAGTTVNLKALVSVKRNGYAYVYFSNESDNLVYFDNFNLVDTRGPLLQETHYSPWGLKLQAISSDALGIGGATNRYLYNGKEQQAGEFADGTGLEMYDYGARMMDAQLGVWHGIDPLAEKSRRLSPYSYCYNNPLQFIDPDGMMGTALYQDYGSAAGYGDEIKSDKDDGNKMVKYSVKYDKKQEIIYTEILGYDDDDAKTEYQDIQNTDANYDLGAQIQEMIKQGNFNGVITTLKDNYPDEYRAYDHIKLYYPDEQSNLLTTQVVGDKGYIGIPKSTFYDYVNKVSSLGTLARTIYHEFVHVEQGLGLFGTPLMPFNPSSYADKFHDAREVLAYTQMLTNKNLPTLNAKEANGYAGEGSQAYDRLSADDQKKYLPQYNILQSFRIK